MCTYKVGAPGLPQLQRLSPARGLLEEGAHRVAEGGQLQPGFRV